MNRRSTYRVCPYCGASLDPGERCDCRDKKPPSMPQTSRTERGINFAQPIRVHFIPLLHKIQGGNFYDSVYCVI